MPLTQLMSVPRTHADMQAWQFANQANHRDVIRLVETTLGISLAEYPIAPFDPEDPASLQSFLNSHQAMHAAMDTALGLASYNLSEVDWQDPSSLAQWVQVHFVEHNAASQKLGIS